MIYICRAGIIQAKRPAFDACFNPAGAVYAVYGVNLVSVWYQFYGNVLTLVAGDLHAQSPPASKEARQAAQTFIHDLQRAFMTTTGHYA